MPEMQKQQQQRRCSHNKSSEKKNRKRKIALACSTVIRTISSYYHIHVHKILQHNGPSNKYTYSTTLLSSFHTLTPPLNNTFYSYSIFLQEQALFLWFLFYPFFYDEWKKQVSFYSFSMARAWTSSSYLQIHGFRYQHSTWSSLHYQKKLLRLNKALTSPVSTL